MNCCLARRAGLLVPALPATCGQAALGRRKAGEGSALPCVTRGRPTEDNEMRRATGGRRHLPARPGRDFAFGGKKLTVGVPKSCGVKGP